jgi:phospholipase/lecithinase/hemolysin
MTTRRRWHLSALAAAALIVAGCGGGSDGPLTTRVVAFGDSLTDIGAYTVATQIPLGQAAGVPPFFGGKFTTNSHTGYTATNNTSNANVWVEWIAARLGVSITPAEVGFGPAPNRRKCPVALTTPALAGSCTGYAQGGARVTDPAGVGNPNGNGINGTSPAPMTVPMVTQVADHLSAFTRFSSDDIVFVFGGNNDVFVQFGAASQGLPPATAIANVVTAATELVALVKDQIIANGARRVAVLTLPDSAATPFGASLGPAGVPAADQARALLAEMSAQFNAALVAGLSGSGAKIIDARALTAATLANPAAAGLTNVTTPACNATIIGAITNGRVTDGSSLFCNAAPAALFTAAPPAGPGLPSSLNGITPGVDHTKYLFADGVHPTTAGHKILADQVWLKLKDFGWVPDNL